METSLRLLMRDGAIRVTFLPRLDAAQYAELTRLVDFSTTRTELIAAAKEAANRWGVECDTEEEGV